MNPEKAVKEYSIDYCAASFDELFSVLKKWSDTVGSRKDNIQERKSFINLPDAGTTIIGNSPEDVETIDD